jgi:hypothetical protein
MATSRPFNKSRGKKGANAVYGDTPYYLIANWDVKTAKNGKKAQSFFEPRTVI